MPPAPAIDRARALHARAVELYNRGRPADALATLNRARGLLANDGAADDVERATLAARIWISIALNQAELRSLDEGFAALDTARSFADRAGDIGLVALLHCQRGLIELRGGSLANSRKSLDAAVEMLEHIAPRDQAAVLINRGNVAMAEGRLRDARADFERSAAIARAAGLSIEQLHSEHNLAYVEFLLGELSRALRLMDAARGRGLGEDGIVLLDRARVLIEAGLSSDADEALARASELFRRNRNQQDLAETELERARCALALGDVRGARRFAGAARRRFLRRGSERWRRSAELVLLQADLADGRPGGRLVAPAQRLADEFDAEGLRLHARAARLIAIEAELAAGRRSSAVAGLADLGAPRGSDPVTGRMHDHYVRARVAAASGDSTAAAATVRRALAELARYQASFGSIDLRTASAVHGRRLAELDVGLALQGGRAAAIFAAAERARAVSSRMPPVRPPDDPAVADLLAELRQQVETLRAVEQDRDASEKVLRARRDLERRILARSWTVSGSGELQRPASLERVRAALAPAGATLVTYVQAGGTLAAVLVGERTRVVDLGASAPVIEQVRRVRADLDVLAHPTLPASMRSAVRASLTRSLSRLDGALVAPLAMDGPLVVVSTGVLGQLPWASLPSLRGRPVVVAPSATKWLACAEPELAAPTAVAAEGNPVAALVGPGLVRGAPEAAAVGRRWPESVVVTAASTGAFLEAVNSARVLHVAAHGLHQPENPLFSFVRMTDGPVFAHELEQHGRAPEHVILSACEVGLATVRPGDEALGLASVLLTLGTRSVIAGVARVGDEVAEQTMGAYHAKLAAGLDSSVALAEALTEVDTDVVPPFVNFGAAWTAVRAG